MTPPPLDTDASVEAILAELTLEEKAGLCSGADFWRTKAVERLGVGQVRMSDGPHGLRRLADGDNGLVGRAATCFPTAAGLAASWDPALAEEVGAAIGREALNQGVGVVLGPGTNIKRHPLCGRNFEYFSEDPLLSGRMAAGLIRGLDSVGVGASLKHFAANNQEANRNVADSVVDERALREIYLASFEHAIRGGKPATVMSSYNPLNGTYTSEHHWLLTTVLRDEWGWDGVVVSDWGAVNDRVAGVAAGLDLEMPASEGVNDALLVKAVRAGRLDEVALDRVVQRVLRLVRRYSVDESAARPVDVDAHHALARRAAAASVVLLRNDGGLPMARGGSVAVIGGFADRPRFQGAGSSQVTPTRVDTLLDAMRAALGDDAVTYAKGYSSRDHGDPHVAAELVAEAVAAARAADTAVVMVGLPPSYESEGFDRRDMAMPHSHGALVEAVVAANPNTVVVVSAGAAVDIPWAERPRALLLAHLGGQASGSGLCDVLLGEVNPSGKLAESYPFAQAHHASDAWFPGERQVQYRESIYVGYRWFHTAGIDVRFPFGHGLSYTSFEIGDLRVEGNTDADAADFGLQVSVAVTNKGSVAGAEVVQVYVRAPGRAVHRPERELRGFAKVHLAPGESSRATITLDRRAFAHWDVASHAWQVEPGAYDVLVGVSSSDIRAQTSVAVTSSFVAAPSMLAAGWRPAAGGAGGAGGAGAVGSVSDAEFAALLGRAIPAPTPSRPFTRNSTVEEVSAVWPGRLLYARLVKEMSQQYGVDPTTLGDDSMLFHIVREMPLRTLVTMSRGKLGWKAIDRLIRLMNHWPSGRRR